MGQTKSTESSREVCLAILLEEIAAADSDSSTLYHKLKTTSLVNRYQLDFQAGVGITIAILEPEHRLFVHKLAPSGPADISKKVAPIFA